MGRGAAFFRGGFFPRTVSHNIGSALLISNPWFSNKKSLTLFKLGETFISNFLPTIKAVGRQKAFALSEEVFDHFSVFPFHSELGLWALLYIRKVKYFLSL